MAAQRSQLNDSVKSLSNGSKIGVHTVQAQKRFLDNFRQSGVVLRAAIAAGVGRQTHYDWLDKDPNYAREFEDAKQDAADLLEEELYRRALDRTKLDTTALIVGLKMTGRFKDRYEHSGPGGGPVPIQHSGEIVLELEFDERPGRRGADAAPIVTHRLEHANGTDDPGGNGSAH